MPWPQLPIENLAVWAHLNEVSFVDVKVTTTKEKGFGICCERDLHTTGDSSSATALLRVPHHLVLNDAAVEEYAKEDKDFRHLLDAVGHHRSARADILLFLLVQAALASRRSRSSVGVTNPWTEYLQFLPEMVLLPTLWTEDERVLLRGTSLEPALEAKISALDAEFERIREKSSEIRSWDELLWQGGSIRFTDWIRLDALYRSRCLELPRSGESMVPCIDMINHSANPSAYYDENPEDEVVLMLRPGIDLSKGDEITISYGATKSAAEMLFSYGFVDAKSAAHSLVLPLRPFPDDPLAKAKLVAFEGVPQICVARESESVRWTSEFAYLMCINEEDGLEFRILQERDGAQELRVFWQEEDVTDRTREFETLIQGHSLFAVLRLRVVTVIQENLQTQLEQLQSSTPGSTPSALQRKECFDAALSLRGIETSILESAIEALEKERSSLLLDENVVAYLGPMETTESDLVGNEASNDADDFS